MRRVRAAVAPLVIGLVVLAGAVACGSDEAAEVAADGAARSSSGTVDATPSGTTGGTVVGTVPDTDPGGTALGAPPGDEAPTSAAPVPTAPPPPRSGPDPGPAPPPAPDPDPGSGSGSGSGCGIAQDGFAAVGGGRRVLVRASEASTRRPAVVVLHGYTGVPERIEATSGWTPFALAQGAVVAYPEGTAVGAGGFGWNTGSGRFSTAGVDDAAYLATVVDHLVATACVDPTRILLTGESNGGAMTVIAACSPATRDRFAAFAPVIPAVDQGVLDRCGVGPPVSLTALAGRLDRVIPYDGVYPPGQLPLLAQETWFLRLAALRNGCAAEAVREPVDGGEAIRAVGCPLTPVLIAVDDGTHTWPGGPSGTGSQDPGRFPATAYLWSVFAST